LAEEYEETVLVDYMLPFDLISEDLLEELALGEPYGEAFPPPRFVTSKVRILRETIIKDTHHFMTLVDATKKEVGTTLWNYGDEELLGRECTIIYDIYSN
jgi:single-stranded DNA-specific DHH superfamily exonuclease